MAQTTIYRFLTNTKLFYKVCHFQPRLISSCASKSTANSAIFRPSRIQVTSRSSVTANVLSRQWGRPHTNRIVVPALCNYSCPKRWFHLTPRRQVAFPPLVWAVVKFGAKLGAIITGRGLRRWLKTQPKEVRNKYYKLLLAKIIGLISLSSIVGTIYYYNHQQEAPITHRKRFISLTREQYLKVADFEAENFLEQFKEDTLPATHPYYEIVLNIARKLVAANQDFPGMSGHKWTITVVKSDEKNAFVLPNGYVFVYTGLIEFVDNKDQLAMVIGHEMAHALMLHAAEQLSYSQLLDYLVILLMAAIWFVMPSDGIAVVTQWFYNKVVDVTVHMPYSRKLEREADIVGLQLASKACYDVREGSVFWEKMNIASQLNDTNIPEWASTHPTHEKRVETFDFLLPKAIEQREKNHCPALPQCDPRDNIKRLRLVVDNVKTAHRAKANLNQVQRVRDRGSFFPGLRGNLSAADGGVPEKEGNLATTEGDFNMNASVGDEGEGQTKIEISKGKDSQVTEKLNIKDKEVIKTDTEETANKGDNAGLRTDKTADGITSPGDNKNENQNVWMKGTPVDVNDGQSFRIGTHMESDVKDSDTSNAAIGSEKSSDRLVTEDSEKTDETVIESKDGIGSRQSDSTRESQRN